MHLTPCQLKRVIRKRERLFKKARRSKHASHWQCCKSYRNLVKKQIQQAHESYVNEVIGWSLEEGNAKSFKNYIKLKKKNESIGIPPLCDSNRLVSSNSGKANILNSYFKSAFTAEDTSTIPNEGTSPLPDIADISFTATGIVKQLQLLKPMKASAPDQDKIKFLLGFLKTLLIHVLPCYKGFFNNLMNPHAYH